MFFKLYLLLKGTIYYLNYTYMLNSAYQTICPVSVGHYPLNITQESICVPISNSHSHTAILHQKPWP